MYRRNILLIGIIVVVVSITLLILGYSWLFTAKSFRGTYIEEGLEPIDFRLIDQYGSIRRFSDFEGKYIVMSFIYTHCPDICPPITLELKRLWSRIREEGLIGQVVIMLITVDPERDTPERFREWASIMGIEDFILLTGEYSELKEVWDWYGIYVAKSNMTHPGHEGYTVDHTGLAILFDRRGYARVFYPGAPPEWRYEDILNDLKILMSMGL